MEVVKLQRDKYDLWNEFLIKSNQNCIFSNSKYLDSLSANYEIIICQSQSEILAGMVLAKNEIGLKNNPIFSKYLGLYYGEINGNRYNIQSKKRKIATLFCNYLSKEKSFNYYFHPDINDWLPFYWNNFKQETRYTYRIELNEISKIRKNYHNKLRNDIKNAKNKEVKVIFSPDLDKFHSVYNATYLRQGSNAPLGKKQLISFLKKQQSNNTIRLFAATLSDGTYISVCGIVFDTRSAYLIINGIDIENHIRGANALMIDTAIESFVDEVKIFDFEGSMHKDIEVFYRKFGGELTPYYRIYKPSFINFFFSFAKKMYKKIKYGK